MEVNCLRKLTSITLPELELLAQAIAVTGLAAYQEGILTELERGW